MKRPDALVRILYPRVINYLSRISRLEVAYNWKQETWATRKSLSAF